MRLLLGMFTLLIVYGSLYPFNFDPGNYDPALQQSLWSFSIADTSRGDFIANLLLFVPFGFTATHVLAGRAPMLQLTLILSVGFVLAFAIQVAQLLIPGRVPAGADAVLNFFGCAIGCAIAYLPLNRFLARFTGVEAYPPIPLILGCLWLIYNWAPFIPSVDFQLLKNSLKMILAADLNIWWLFQKIVMWLVIFHFLAETGSKLGRDKLYPLIVLIILIGSLFIVDHSTTIEHVAGGVLSIPAWYIIRNRRRAPILAISLGLAVLTTTFTPFELRSEINSFGWIPFSASLNSNLLLNVLSIFKKLIVYGSLIWLLVEAWFSLRLASVIVAALLLASEMLQVMFKGPTPEITDALLALAIGVSFHFYESARLARSGPPDETEVGSMSENFKGMGKDTPTTNHLGQSSLADQPNLLELDVNLHRYQATFLDRAARKLGWSQAQVCSELIALARLRPPKEPGLLQLTGSDFGLSIRRRNSKWVALKIPLEESVLEDLEALSAEVGQSTSYTLRHLLKGQISKLSSQVHFKTILLGKVSAAIALTEKYHRLIAGTAIVVLAALLVSKFTASSSSFHTAPAWAGNDATIILDHHTHTNYSDGALPPQALVELAIANGCDALAITDHSDKGGSASSEQIKDIIALRSQYPTLTLFTGIELNMPSYNGREHVNVITEPEYETEILRRLGNLADDYGSKAADDQRLLEAISQYQNRDIQLVVSYNHPSRKAPTVDESLEDLAKWDPSGELFSILSGSPGHQNAKVIGSYQPPHLTEDRWDPVVATVGGVWDKLLSRGHNVWGAIAPSDYHNKKLDKPPCSFSRTHVSAPSSTHKGILRAIRAGTFWADHGHLLNRLNFSVELDGLDKPAYPGAIVKLGSQSSIASTNLTLERGKGSEGSPLTFEVISNCSTGITEVLYTEVLDPVSSESHGLFSINRAGEDSRSCFVRARVRLYSPTGPDLLAYTNPIRILL